MIPWRRAWRFPPQLPQHSILALRIPWTEEAGVLQCSAFLIVQLSHPHMITGKTIALTRQTSVDKAMCLLFNVLSRLVIAFLPRSKWLLISWLQSPSAVILEPQVNKVSHCFHCFPVYLPWSIGEGNVNPLQYSGLENPLDRGAW